MSTEEESGHKEVLKLDPQSLEAIIERVAAKLQKEGSRTPGEHSGARSVAQQDESTGE